MLSIEEARSRVAKGAAHLDRVRPGWFHRIDVGTLTMWDPCGCVVGQICGNFNAHLRQLLPNQDCVEFGLNLPWAWDSYSEPTPEWTVLQDAWIEAIADRRLASISQPDLVAAPPVAQEG